MNEPTSPQTPTRDSVTSSDLLSSPVCAKCGLGKHDAKDCEYPFPQGHASRQRRDQDWSALANQVVGAEDNADLSRADTTPKQKETSNGK